MIGYSKKNRENAFKLRKQRPGLKFNPWLALIGFQITWPKVEKKERKWSVIISCKCVHVAHLNLRNSINTNYYNHHDWVQYHKSDSSY